MREIRGPTSEDMKMKDAFNHYKWFWEGDSSEGE